MSTLSRAASYLAQKFRNQFPDGASADLIARTCQGYENCRPFRADDRIRLGSGDRNILASRLAIGSGTDGWSRTSSQTRNLSLEELSNLHLHAFHQHGINFWETADEYGAHPHLALALTQVPRDQVVVLTKTVAETPDAMRKELDRFRKELGIEHIDILLMHCMTSPSWPEQQRGVMDVISEAQEKGIIGLKGVSCHSFTALEAAVDEPWVEVDLARINPGGLSMDAGPDRVVPVLEKMKRKEKSVLGMKILGNGKLAEHREACLQFVLGLESVDAFTIGFESTTEIDEIVGLIAGPTQ